MQSKVALSYHKVRGLYFLTVIFERNMYDIGYYIHYTIYNIWAYNILLLHILIKMLDDKMHITFLPPLTSNINRLLQEHKSINAVH